MSASKMTQGQSSRRVLMGARGKTPSGVASNRHPGKRSFLQMIKNPANTALLLALVSYVAHSATDPSVSKRLQESEKKLDDWAKDMLEIQQQFKEHQDNILAEDHAKLRQLEDYIEELRSGNRLENDKELTQKEEELEEMRKKMNRVEEIRRTARSLPPKPIMEDSMNRQLRKLLTNSISMFYRERDRKQLRRLVENINYLKELKDHAAKNNLKSDVEKLDKDISKALTKFEQFQEKTLKVQRNQMMLLPDIPYSPKIPIDYVGMNRSELEKWQTKNETQLRILTNFLRTINPTRLGEDNVSELDVIKLRQFQVHYRKELANVRAEMDRQGFGN